MHNRTFHIPVRCMILIIVFLCLPLTSCVYDQQLQYLNDQVVALNRRVSTLEKTMDKRVGKDLDTKLGAIRSRQASMGADLDQIKGEISSLSSRVHDNERVIKGAVELNLGDQDKIRENLADLSKRVNRLQRLVAQQQGYLGLEPPPGLVEQKVGGGPAPGQQGAAPAPPGVAPTVAPSVAPTVAPTVEGKITQPPGGQPKAADVQAYDQVLALYRQGQYQDAIQGFQAFLKNYPKSDLADNAQFWIGECYMDLKQYEKAILAYQQVIKKYPKGNKIANALLRQAMAFLEINDSISSKLLLKKIIRDYPRSSEAAIAKKKLATMK